MSKRPPKQDTPALPALGDAPKPVVRIKAGSSTRDGFQNFAAQLGLGADNAISAGRYGFDFTTRNRTMLEAAYRTSWLVGAAVDIPADDMTSAGIELTSTIDPDEVANITAALRDLMLPQKMSEAIRWSRLFGGAVAIMLIDGQRLDTPLRMETVRKDAFRGLMVMDRWMVQPANSEIITDLGPGLGLPKYYSTVSDNQALAGKRIHHSRCLRFVGHELPYYQSLAEQRWGMSVIERIHDRLIAFDSTSSGAAQLAFKAHLRTMKIEGFRDLLAAGGPMYDSLLENVAMIRRLQTSEGLTILDMADELQVDTYTFAGLADIITSQGEQLSGAIEIPMVRLFGQAPGGLNTDGGSALATYHDGNKRKQEAQLRRPWTVVLDVLVRSVTGKPPPPGFTFEFNPLGQVDPQDRAVIAKDETAAVGEAFDKGIISQRIALTELRNSGRRTGLFTSITQEDIDNADDTIPDATETLMGPDGLPLVPPAGGAAGGGGAATPGQVTEGNVDPEAPAGRAAADGGRPRKTTVTVE